MRKCLLTHMLPFLIPVLLLAGCGWNTENSLGDHKEVVNKMPANNVVGGKVVHNIANAVIMAVSINTTTYPPATYIIGTNGSFAIANVNGTGRVIAGLVVGNSRQQLYSNISTLPSPSANIISTYRDNWNGETSFTIDVEGNINPIHVTPLTDIVYRPLKSATRKEVNDYLNQYFATTSIDYVATPQPSTEVTTLAINRFPR